MGKKRKTIDEKAYKQKLRERGLNDRGQLVPDSVPMAPPIGYKRQPSMVEIIRDMVRSEKLAEEARNSGHETFEESEDFDIGDDGEDLRSGFENDFDPPVSELERAVREHKEAQQPPSTPAQTAPQEAPTAPAAPSSQTGTG